MKISQLLHKFIHRPQWHNFRNLKPISRLFGFDRGTPIDRFYIENFLSENTDSITGTVCEIADDCYSKKFGHNISKNEILHVNSNDKATIIGDLTQISSLPENHVDCFICTQTLNFIYDFKTAIYGIHQMLKPGGVALVTVAGLCQISRYDMDKWGDYWRFTDLSIRKSFEEVFAANNIETQSYGNVLTTTALLQGISAEELTPNELQYNDQDYQIIITVKAIK